MGAGSYSSRPATKTFSVRRILRPGFSLPKIIVTGEPKIRVEWSSMTKAVITDEPEFNLKRTDGSYVKGSIGITHVGL